jgi:hypothetical protein
MLGIRHIRLVQNLKPLVLRSLERLVRLAG